MKLVEVKVHCHELEVWHMSFRRIMKYLRRFIKLVEHFGNMGWKVREVAWSL